MSYEFLKKHYKLPLLHAIINIIVFKSLRFFKPRMGQSELQKEETSKGKLKEKKVLGFPLLRKDLPKKEISEKKTVELRKPCERKKKEDTAVGLKEKEEMAVDLEKEEMAVELEKETTDVKLKKPYKRKKKTVGRKKKETTAVGRKREEKILVSKTALTKNKATKEEATKVKRSKVTEGEINIVSDTHGESKVAASFVIPSLAKRRQSKAKGTVSSEELPSASNGSNGEASKYSTRSHELPSASNGSSGEAPKYSTRSKLSVVIPPPSSKNYCSVVGREAEYSQLQKQISYFCTTGLSSVLYITGVPGSGKTFTVLRLFQDLNIPHLYVNCAKLRIKAYIYREIALNLTCTSSTEPVIKASPSLHSLRFHFTNCNQLHFLIIDEVDLLLTKSEAYFYNLFELPFTANCKIFLIAISNTLKIHSTKVESRIGKNRMEFSPYTSTQICDVYKTRANINSQSLMLVAKRVASTTGDIRKVEEVIGRMENKSIVETNEVLKQQSVTLLQRFMETLGVYHKLAIYLNKEGELGIQGWFINLNEFCGARKLEKIDFVRFRNIMTELQEYGILKIKENSITINYLKEEIDMAAKTDEDFKWFSMKNML